MSVVLFRQPDFGGRTTQIGTSVSSLPNSDDNRADSVTVKETPWMLYTRPNFEGSLSILDPGEYRNPEEMGIPSDTISSLRPFPIPNTNSILLFEDFDFKGRMIHLSGSMDDLRAIGFNDTASSAIVLSGSWFLYRDVDFGGDPFLLPVGRFPRAGENDALSSAKPV